MPYDSNNFPAAMKNLPRDVRIKAIEILNALIEDTSMEEGNAIATAIANAKEHNANHNTAYTKSAGASEAPAKNQFVLPHENGWAVKTDNAKKASRVFHTKEEAVSYGKERAQKNKGTLTVQYASGEIQDRWSYI